MTGVATATLVKNSRSTRSTIALKLLMAVSGIIFIGFVLAHMYGNLKAFAGHDAYNEYAEHLRAFGEPILPREGMLWILRTVLIVSLLVHVAAALRPVAPGQAGPPGQVRDEEEQPLHQGLAPDALGRRDHPAVHRLAPAELHHRQGERRRAAPTNDPYNLLVDSFETWWLTLIYLAAMAMLGAHLHHGIWSSLQTMGLTNNANARARAKQFGFVVALIITVGFSIVPVFILAGVITK